MGLYKILHFFFSKKKNFNLILSGGKSSLKQYLLFSQTNIAWKNINIYLTDDRIVNINNKFSNYRNIKNSFGRVKSSLHLNDLNIIKLFRSNKHKISLFSNLRSTPTLTFLSMGDDGHFASIFHNSKQYKDLINPLSKPNVYFVEKIGNPKLPRITMNLSLILISDLIIINIISSKKRNLFYKLLNNKDKKYPISAVLKHAKNKILVYDGKQFINLKS